MFSLLSGFVTWLFSKDELKILMVGLDYAGKTTLLERIKHAYTPSYRGIALDAIPPTIGMNLAKVVTQRVEVTLWDVGGAMNSIWDRYYADAEGLIFVVDASDPTRFARVQDTLATVLSHPALEGLPLLLVGNKADVPGAATAVELRAALLRGLPRDARVGLGPGAASSGPMAAAAAAAAEPAGWGPPRDCRIVCCSALRGEGVRDAIEWLVGVTTKNHYAELTRR